MSGWPRYEPRLDGSQCCLDCGAIIADRDAHTRFHSILNGHAWVLAVLKNTHLSDRTHDRYDAVERIDSKQFDSWSADAFAEVAAPPKAEGLL